MKFLHWIQFGLSLLNAQLRGKKIPFLVQLIVTNNCNLHCSFCYRRYYDYQEKDLTTEQIFSIIDQLVPAGTFRINLTGGEPLVRKDIGQIIDYIKKKGIECTMTTNGQLVLQKLEEVKKLNLLCFSLDGDEKAHDANRGKGSFSKLMQAMEVVHSQKIPLQISTVLTKECMRSLDFLFSIARKYGAHIGFNTLIVRTPSQSEGLTSDADLDEECRMALQKIIEAKKKGVPILNSFYSLKYSLNWPFSYVQDKIIGKPPNFKYIPCQAGRRHIAIDANGNIYPCSATVKEVPALNCLEVGFEKSWEKAASHNCQICHLPCNNELNLLLGLNFNAIINFLKGYKKVSSKKKKSGAAIKII